MADRTERAKVIEDFMLHKGYALLLGELTSITKSAYSYLEDSKEMEGVMFGRGMLDALRQIDIRLQAISKEIVK